MTLNHATYHKAPEELRERVRASIAAAAREERGLPGARMFALAASFMLVAMVSWNAALWHERTTHDDVIADEAVQAHVRSTMSHLTDVVSSDRHTVKPWFIGKVDFAPPVNDFASSGFALAGGRLDRLGGRPVAALVYRHNAHVVNVFVSPTSAGDSRSPVSMRRGYAVARWTQAGLAFEAVGDISAEDMTALADLIAKG